MTLHRDAVSQALMELLQTLMQDPFFTDFYLVGGTSLALRFAHRESIDIDLFTHQSFDSAAFSERLKEQYGMIEAAVPENSVSGWINDIKLDLIAHRYPLLRAIDVIDGIRLASIADVAAMKLNAIANRGSKKDFFDVHSLLELFSLTELLAFFEEKYSQVNSFTVLKSLTYFDDAEADPEPLSLVDTSWHDVKVALNSLVKNHF